MCTTYPDWRELHIFLPIYFILQSVYVCESVLVRACEYRCLRRQKRVSGPLEQESQAVVSCPLCVLGTKLWSSVRAVHAFDQRTIPAPRAQAGPWAHALYTDPLILNHDVCRISVSSPSGGHSSRILESSLPSDYFWLCFVLFACLPWLGSCQQISVWLTAGCPVWYAVCLH